MDGWLLPSRSRLRTDAPRYMRYCLGTCLRLLLCWVEDTTALLRFAEAPAIAMAEVRETPVCLERVDEGMRVC